MSLAEGLAARQLVVVTGKGGVGKTTLAAALGRLLADTGRRVLLVETDPRESLHQLLGVEPSGGAVVKVGPRLWLQNLQPRSVVERLVREKVRLSVLANRIVASPIFQHFADGAPGLKEMAILGYALRVLRGEYKPRADVVVLDAPATGHGVSMLAAPLLVSEAIGGGEIGEMALDLARFISDPVSTGVVIGALAEEMPVQEALDLTVLLKEKLGRPPELVVVNSLYPPLPAPRPRPATAWKAAFELWTARRRGNERELKRLRAGWSGPLVELPLLPLERGPALVSALVERLTIELGRERGAR